MYTYCQGQSDPSFEFENSQSVPTRLYVMWLGVENLKGRFGAEKRDTASLLVKTLDYRPGHTGPRK